MKKILILLTTFLLLVGCSPKTSEQTQRVRHIIMWTLNDSIKGNQKEKLIKTSCDDFYTLQKKIPGIISMNAVYEGKLPSSNCDFMFDIIFENEDALHTFSKHPEHLKNAKNIKPYIKCRTCLDVHYKK